MIMQVCCESGVWRFAFGFRGSWSVKRYRESRKTAGGNGCIFINLVSIWFSSLS
jgi:hypothetical protein